MATPVWRIAIVFAVACAGIGLGLAHAGSAQAGTYVVCGYGTAYTLGPGSSSCTTLPDAISAAISSSGADTIEMLPGTYCPIDIETNAYSGITFEGVGIAGIDTSGGPVSISGPEAGLTTFKWDSLHCGSSPPDDMAKINTFISSGPGITFENLTFDGATSGDGNIGYGVYASGNDANVTMRDVIVQNFSASGVYYVSGSSGFTDYGLELDNSAILNNGGSGVEIYGFGSIYDTTVSGNGTGVLQDGDVSLVADTITHNGYGVTSLCCSHNDQAVDTIVADNTSAGCQQTVDWESMSSWNNLFSDESCYPRASSDIVDPGLTLGTPADNGGPTPSILPPTAAQGAGATPCGLDGVDQRESVISGGSCDIGSVQQGANSSTSVTAPAIALGYVDTGTVTDATAEVQSVGGDIVGISGASIAGAGWSIVNDGCTYRLLTHASNGSYCSITVSVTPTSDGEWDATLTVDTTAGTKHISLTSQAVTRATGRDDAYDVPDASLDVSAPGVLANDQAFATLDEVVTQPNNGALTANADGSFTYTPDDDFIGDDSFQYTVIQGGLFESHPITVTLHVLGFTLSLDSASYSSTPGGTFTIEATVTPLRSFTGDVCLDVADTNGSTWPSSVSQGSGYPTCNSDDDDDAVGVGTNVVLDGTNPATVELPINVAADAPPGLQNLEVIASYPSTPSVVAPFGLTLPTTSPPSIDSFHPVFVGAGTSVTINGSNLTGAIAVHFNGTPAQSFVVESDSTIVAVVAAGTTSGLITVTTPVGTSTSPNPYTFFAQPTITSLSVTNAAVGSSVIVNGTSLNGATSVTLHGTHVPFSVVSSAKITFTVPAGATTGTVTVVSPGGSATSSASITVGPPPTITSFSPGSGPVGTPVTITGTNLGGTVGIEIGTTITVPASVSPTSVTFAIPPGAAGGTIKVLTTSGSATSADSFTVTG